LSIVSDIDDTIKVTHVPAGKKTVLRNTFLKRFEAAPGMVERYQAMAAEAGPEADVCFHYVSGSPWQMHTALSEFLHGDAGFPLGTFHMKNLRMNVLEPGAMDSLRAFVLGGDLSTLDQKVRQITHLMMQHPQRDFILVGDSGERDPEVYRAIQRLFSKQIRRILIRDVLAERLQGMERIAEGVTSVFFDTSELEKEMMALVTKAAHASPESPKL
jgi:phosphatidate phosphatase APP1